MDPEKRARLEKSWAHAFRTSALPLIDEDQFRRYFADDNGRPNKSVRLVVSVLILKEIQDLTDREALEQLEWNAAWHYALDLVPDDAHTCQKTLHNFRAMLLRDDLGGRLFEETTRRLIVAAALKTARQRHDSTHTVSNIRILTRLGLFTATITKFLEALRADHPRICNRLPVELRERYLDREGYFSDARSSEAPRRMELAALDTHALVSLFKAHPVISKMTQFQLIARIYRDQCEPPDSDSPTKIDLRKFPESSSLQSPSDPDVTYSGNKGKGYSVQISETCDPDNPIQLLTTVGLTDANVSDQHQIPAILDQAERTCGALPEVLHADAGYASGANIVAAQDRGTDLRAPIAAEPSTESFPIDRFIFNDDRTEVVSCPNKAKPVEHRLSHDKLKVLAVFPSQQCGPCPISAICPAKARKGTRVLSFDRASVATAQRRTQQQTSEFKEEQKIRSGIEATNSELKRGLGLRKLRVRGKARVTLSVRLKALALNFKRYAHYVAQTLAAAPPPGQTCAC